MRTFEPKKETLMTDVQGRYVGELLRGYIEGQIKRYRSQHADKTYDLSDAQVLARICDNSNPKQHKLSQVVGAYSELVATFDLDDNLLKI